MLSENKLIPKRTVKSQNLTEFSAVRSAGVSSVSNFTVTSKSSTDREKKLLHGG